MTRNEEMIREIGGQWLIDFYDSIQTEQRKRWAVPDWRTQQWIDADFTNARDTAAALKQMFRKEAWL